MAVYRVVKFNNEEERVTGDYPEIDDNGYLTIQRHDGDDIVAAYAPRVWAQCHEIPEEDTDETD